MFAFISTLAQASGVIVDKIILTRRQVALHVYLPILFIFLFLLTAILFPFLGKIDWGKINAYYLIIFLAMVVAGIIWNIFYYRGVQSEKVHELELLMMLQPFLTIILASIFLKGENNIYVEASAIIAAIFLIIAHLEKRHVEFTSGIYNVLLAVVFISVELILIKILLNVFSPVAIYFLRTAIFALFFIFFFRPHLKKVAKQNYGLILITSVLGTAQMITKFYGFEDYGVVYTSLILIASPILVYIVSTLLLHERLKTKTVLSAAVILGCIIYATMMGR